jgi:hypothetical protein
MVFKCPFFTVIAYPSFGSGVHLFHPPFGDRRYGAAKDDPRQIDDDCGKFPKLGYFRGISLKSVPKRLIGLLVLEEYPISNNHEIFTQHSSTRWEAVDYLNDKNIQII